MCGRCWCVCLWHEQIGLALRLRSMAATRYVKVDVGARSWHAVMANQRADAHTATRLVNVTQLRIAPVLTAAAAMSLTTKRINQ